VIEKLVERGSKGKINQSSYLNNARASILLTEALGWRWSRRREAKMQSIFIAHSSLPADDDASLETELESMINLNFCSSSSNIDLSSTPGLRHLVSFLHSHPMLERLRKLFPISPAKRKAKLSMGK
jgi:hypothetical protein